MKFILNFARNRNFLVKRNDDRSKEVSSLRINIIRIVWVSHKDKFLFEKLLILLSTVDHIMSIDLSIIFQITQYI